MVNLSLLLEFLVHIYVYIFKQNRTPSSIHWQIFCRIQHVGREKGSSGLRKDSSHE